MKWSKKPRSSSGKYREYLILHDDIHDILQLINNHHDNILIVKDMNIGWQIDPFDRQKFIECITEDFRKYMKLVFEYGVETK